MFSNQEVINDAPIELHFDIEIKANEPGTFHRDLQIYLDYNPEVFGSNIVENNNVLVSGLELLSGHYLILNVTDNTSSRIAIITEAIKELNLPGSEENFNGVPTTFSGFIHVEMMISSLEQSPDISFSELLMNGGQFYQDTLTVDPIAYATPCQFENEISEFPLSNQTIQLPPGWSGISSYIQPQDDNIEIMFEDITSEMVILQNESGIFWPGQNINTIGNWDMSSGYQIKMATPHELMVSGSRLQNYTLSLTNNWNLMPVLTECEAEATTLFESTSLTILKEVAGWQVYWPEFGINTLGSLEPGKAYFALMDDESTIVFPECDGLKNSAPENPITYNDLKNLTSWNIIQPTTISHTIAIPGEIFNGLVTMEGDILGIFDVQGNCYGIAPWKNQACALTAFGDDPLTGQKDGFAVGEEMYLHILNTKENEEMQLDAVYDLSMPATRYFSENGLSAIKAATISSTGLSEAASIQEVEIIPNPAHDAFILRLSSEPIQTGRLILYNIEGQEIMNEQLQSQNNTINISHLSKGIYLLNISVDGNIMNKRLVKK
jgi:hypothetical protein